MASQSAAEAVDLPAPGAPAIATIRRSVLAARARSSGTRSSTVIIMGRYSAMFYATASTVPNDAEEVFSWD